MDPTETLTTFLAELRTSYPETVFHDVNVEVNIGELEALYPHTLRILQRDPEFFSTNELTLFGVRLDELDSSESIWKHLHVCMMSSLFHGDLKEKMGKLLSTAKALWSSSGQTNSEVDRILNDENAEDHFQEVFDYITNLRSAKIFLEILEEVDVGSLGLSLDDPNQLVEIFRNPEHPKLQKAIQTVQRLLKQKLERGQLSQQQLTSDVEGIKTKIQSMFGNILGEALGVGGRRPGGVEANLLAGRNSHGSEAARIRLQARWKRRNEKRE
jgi:hypothetical protein